MNCERFKLVVHTYPVNDLREHVLEGTDCPCNPEVERCDNGAIHVIHNSYDKREVM